VVLRACESRAAWRLLGRACCSGRVRVGLQRFAQPYDGVLAQAQALVMVEDFNDRPTTTHADVMALFERAIELCRGT
jgi:hypothetical protein